MDMDIYFEDGMLVYSEKEVKSFNPRQQRKFSRAMLWVKIETRFLKPGEYKAEVMVRDEFSGKMGFALERFVVRGEKG